MRERMTNQRGQQMVLIALLLPVLLASLGLVVDVGLVYVHRRLVQNATDAAATAASMILYDKGAAIATDTAYWYAGQHGYDNDGVSNTVLVTTPPNCVHVDITENVNSVFAAIVWNGAFHVHAQASACFVVEAIGPSVIVLEENVCETLLTQPNNARIIVRNGNIQVNSHCVNAVDLGNGEITTQSPVSIVGSWIGGPNGHFYDMNGEPSTPVIHQPVLPDPLANLPVPNLASYPTRYGTAAKPNMLKITGGTVTLNPGVYYGGINLTGGNVTLNPGVYIMAGGGFSVSGNTNVQGDGVFFYLTKDASNPSGDGAAGSLTLMGTGLTSFTAPSSGTYAGVTFFQDRDNYIEGHIAGTSDTTLGGIIYMKNGDLRVSGNATLDADLVVRTLRLDGSTLLTVNGWQGQIWTTVTSNLTD